MTVIYEDEYEKEWPFNPEELAEEVINACLDYEKCPYESQVSLLLTTGPEIHRMNREFRGIDRETDVLSFPMQVYEIPGDFSGLEEEQDSFDPDSGELLLGDIVLNGDRGYMPGRRIWPQRKKRVCIFVAHSMLHLMGYDHMTKEEADVMEGRQDEILNLLNIKR